MCWQCVSTATSATITLRKWQNWFNFDLVVAKFTLDKEEPEVRKFSRWGMRSLLLATKYMGYDYDWFYVDASNPRNPQTKYHEFAVHKSRFRGWARQGKYAQET